MIRSTIWCALLLQSIIFNVSEADSECGGILSKPKGTITSPGYPKPYGNETKCVWHFSIAEKYSKKYQIFISINELEIQDGDEFSVSQNDSSVTIANFSSRSDPRIVAVFAPNATITFQSEDGLDRFSLRRFNFSYSTKGCEQYVENVNSANIQGPIYLATEEQVRVKCSYKLSTLLNKRMALTFSVVDIPKGEITVYDGEQASKPVITLKAETTESSDILSTGNEMKVEIEFAPSQAQIGFRAAFMATSRECTETISVNQSAIKIESPNYPRIYPNNLDCRWIVTGPVNTTLYIWLDDLDLADQFDELIIKDGNARTEKTLPKLNIGNSHGVYLTSGNSFWAEFTTDEVQIQAKRGFVLNVVPTANGGAFYGSGQIELDAMDNPHGFTLDDIYFLITVDQGMQVSFEVNDTLMFPTAFIQFHDGKSDTDPIIGNFRSNKPFYTVFSSGNELMVVAKNFISNGTMTRQYFTATYKGFQKGLSKNSAGTSDTFSVTKSQLNSEDIVWLIQNPQEGVISLKITYLNLPPNCTLGIYDGLATSSLQIAEYTGRQLFIPTYHLKEARISIHNTLNQELSKDDGERNVFNAFYEIVPDCRSTFQEKHGVFNSPDFPNFYPLNAYCNWYIPIPSPKILHIQFNSFEMSKQDSISIHTVENMTHIENGTVINVTTTTDVAKYSGRAQPDDILITSSSKVWVEFSSVYDGQTQEGALGFSAAYEMIECGGNVTLKQQTVQTPGYPTPVGSNVKCVWIVNLPATSTDKSNATFENILSYTLDIRNYRNDSSTLEIRDGGSAMSPMVSLDLKDGTTKKLLSRGNKLWISYNHNSSDVVGFSFQLKYTTYACPSAQLCGNGICMHQDWHCNGVDDCGDGSDESDCVCMPNKEKISAGALVGAIFATFIIATVVACATPAIYKRIKYPNYSQLQDLMTPVPT